MVIRALITSHKNLERWRGADAAAIHGQPPEFVIKPICKEPVSEI